jgi:hypothetical protein
MTTLMEDVIKSGRKDGSAERDILGRTGALMAVNKKSIKASPVS